MKRLIFVSLLVFLLFPALSFAAATINAKADNKLNEYTWYDRVELSTGTNRVTILINATKDGDTYTYEGDAIKVLDAQANFKDADDLGSEFIIEIWGVGTINK